MKTIIIKIRTFVAIFSILAAIISCSNSSDDLFRIEKNHLFGYIDSLGRETIPPQYVIAGLFHNGLACVVSDTVYVHNVDTVVFLDRPMVMNRDTVFITYGYIDSKNNWVIKPDLKFYIARDNSLLGRMRQGDDPLSAKGIESYIEDRLGFPVDGLAIFQSRDGKYGYIDRTGRVVVEAKYIDAKIFSEGKAPVCIDEKQAIGVLDDRYFTKRLWGCIDTKGNTVIDFIFKSIEPFCNDRSFVEYDATVEQNSDIAGELTKDEDGNWIVDTTKAITGTETRRTPITNEYLIDEKGNILTEPLGNLYSYGGFTKSGLSTANPNGFGAAFGMSAYYLDKQGKRIEPGRDLTDSEIEHEVNKPHRIGLLPENASIVQCDRFSSGFASICAGEGKWLFVDTNLIICGKDEANWLYEDAWPFSSGLAAVKLDGKYGYIDTNFELVIQCRYDTADYFEGPLAFVTNSKDGVTISSYINKKGEIVWQKIEKDIE